MASKKNKDRHILMFAAVFALIGVASLASSYATKGGKPSSGTNSSLNLVLLDPTKTEAHYGDKVTFNVVSPTATKWVTARCTQNNVEVYVETRGFFPEYPWGQTFTLGPTNMWTSGGATCTAELFTTNRSKNVTLATTSFSVSE